MIEIFGGDIIRIQGIDGERWGNSTSDEDNRPQWDPSALAELRSRDIVSDSFSPFYRLVPGELGCTLSHRKAWKSIIAHGVNAAVVLEDDIKKTDNFISFDHYASKMDGCDVLFLSGANVEYDFGGITRPCVTLDKADNVIKAFGTYAYIITNKGASLALEATDRSCLPLPSQWFPRAFVGYSEYSSLTPKLKNQCIAKGLKTAAIQVSEYDKFSTMAIDGKKTWRTKTRIQGN